MIGFPPHGLYSSRSMPYRLGVNAIGLSYIVTVESRGTRGIDAASSSICSE
eukprot:m.130613 g.130613  ORF g.130613 m.130613 type:complete len:51 (+) comp13721_c0_seq4:224-376(+)